MISCMLFSPLSLGRWGASHDGRIGMSSYALLPRRAVLCCSLTMIQPESQGQTSSTAPWMKTAVVYFGSVASWPRGKWGVKCRSQWTAEQLCCANWQGKFACQHKSFVCTPHLYARELPSGEEKAQGTPHWLDSKIKLYSFGIWDGVVILIETATLHPVDWLASTETGNMDFMAEHAACQVKRGQAKCWGQVFSWNRWPTKRGDSLSKYPITWMS